MARKFLYIIAFITVLSLAAVIALAIWSREATEIALVPRGEFVEQSALDDNAYQDPAMWFSRPGIGTSDPARYQPAITQPPEDIANRAATPDTPAAERSLGEQVPSLDAGETAATRSAAASASDLQNVPDFAVFFVHPTSYIPLAITEEAQWNAPLDDTEASERARLFLRGMASAFNRAEEIWAPRYRQAVAGAFLTDKPEGQLAIDAAYRDVREAFAYFIESIPADQPIVIAGHSQGSLHLLRLMQEEIAGTPTEARIAAAYPIGWPISVADDLPALPFEACASADQSACIVTWSSFAEPFDTSMVLGRFSQSESLTGRPRGEGPILCVNPLTGSTNSEAERSANLGTLVPDGSLSSARLVAGAVPARCNQDGLLLIGDPPQMGDAVLPGNNFHVYDIPLFWANLQADVVARVTAFDEASGAAR
jgi:hypothetical protein